MVRHQIRAHAERFATTRATLIVVGVISGFSAYSTRHAYTRHDLPPRDFLVALLVAMCVMGLGTAIVRPNPVTRSRMGLALMVYAFVRAGGLADLAARRSDGLLDLIGNMNGVYAYALAFYLGYLLFGRARQDVNTKPGETDS